MNSIKRAGFYLVRKKGKSLSLLLFLLVMATMMLTCISIQTAAKDAGANVRKALMGSFTVNAKTLEHGLEESCIEQILSIDGQSGNYNLRSYTQAVFFDKEGNPLTIRTEGAAAVPEGYEHAGKVAANSCSEKDTYFTEAGFSLTKGKAITPEDKNAVLLHEDFAERNGLTLGDTLFLGSVTEEDIKTEVTVQGLFTNTAEQDSLGRAPSYDLYENVVFTDISACSMLVYGETGYCQYGDFYVNDPEMLDSIIDKVKKIPGMEWQKCIVTKYDKDYQNAKSSLESLHNILLASMTVITGICFLILVLLLIFRMRNRVHEVGVLMAMGISKKSILIQQLLEVFAVATISLVLTFPASSLISGQTASSLLSQADTAEYEVVNLVGNTKQSNTQALSPQGTLLAEIQVSISAKDYLSVWAIGLTLCGAATSIALCPVLRMKPKNILSQMS
ncbi:MAG: FtsX-like permease family protein [Eubacteriales bacterium]|nr:FtsX-like permease family protein [Eubacteriales bacterium]